MLMPVRKVKYQPAGISPGFDHTVNTRCRVNDRLVPISVLCRCVKPLSETCIQKARQRGVEHFANLG